MLQSYSGWFHKNGFLEFTRINFDKDDAQEVQGEERPLIDGQQGLQLPDDHRLPSHRSTLHASHLYDHCEF